MIPHIINQCKNHPSLYKFNGIPIKALESGKLASITLYENYFITSIPLVTNADSDLTMSILHRYRSSFESLSEIRIKKEKVPCIYIYLPKLLKKIEEIGYFCDNSQRFNFSICSFLIIFIAIRKKPEFKCLRLKTMFTHNFFVEALRECEYLEKYEGPSNEIYYEIFRNLRRFNHLSISTQVSEIQLMIPNLMKANIKNTFFPENRNLLLHLPVGLQELYLEKVEFANETAIGIVGNSINTFINLRKLVLFATFKSVSLVNSFIIYIRNARILEFLDISLVFPEKRYKAHMQLINAMENTVHTLTNLREFSFAVENVTSKHIKDLYFEFIMAYKNSNSNLIKLYGVSLSDFNRDIFQKIFY